MLSPIIIIILLFSISSECHASNEPILVCLDEIKLPKVINKIIAGYLHKYPLYNTFNVENAVFRHCKFSINDHIITYQSENGYVWTDIHTGNSGKTSGTVPRFVGGNPCQLSILSPDENHMAFLQDIDEGKKIEIFNLTTKTKIWQSYTYLCDFEGNRFNPMAQEGIIASTIFHNTDIKFATNDLFAFINYTDLKSWDIEIWDFKNNKLIKKLNLDLSKETNSYYCYFKLAFSNDGKKLICAVVPTKYGGTALILIYYDLVSLIKNRREIFFDNYSEAVSINFLPSKNSDIVCLHTGNMLHLWNIKTFKKNFSITISQPYALSPDGNYIAATDIENNIKVWSIDSKKWKKILTGYKESICSLDFSSDQKYLVSYSQNDIAKIWIVDFRLANAAKEIEQPETKLICKKNILPIASVAFFMLWLVKTKLGK